MIRNKNPHRHDVGSAGLALDEYNSVQQASRSPAVKVSSPTNPPSSMLTPSRPGTVLSERHSMTTALMAALCGFLLFCCCSRIDAAETDREFVTVAGSKQVVPIVDFAPGPEYGDDQRQFGIASSITRSPGGRLWCGWSSGGKGEGQSNYVIVVSSDDDGATWSAPRIAIDTKDEKGRKIRTDHLTVWTAPSGELWVMWSQYPRGLQGPQSSQWVITSTTPDADKPTWSGPRKLVDEQNLLTTPTVLSDGTWIFPTGNWQHKNSRPIISRDQGQTFVLGGALNGADTDFDEYMIVERANGHLVSYNRHGRCFLVCESSDQGASWTPEQPNAIPHTNSRFVFMRLRSGKWLLVKHGDMHSVPRTKQSKHQKHAGRQRLMAFVSDDEGETWAGGLMLDERNCSYPFGMQAEDGTIYVSSRSTRIMASSNSIAAASRCGSTTRPPTTTSRARPMATPTCCRAGGTSTRRCSRTGRCITTASAR